MNVLVIGDTILDHYLYGTINRKSPEDPSISVLDVEEQEYRLGGCTNVAANVKSISSSSINEFEVYLSSVFSRFTGNMLFNKGILCDDSCMMQEDIAGKLEPSNHELIKTRVIDKKTGKQLIRIDNKKKYSIYDIDKFIDSVNINNNLDAIVVSDYRKGLINESIISKLENYKGQVFVDSKNPNLSVWDNIENCIVKVNLKEYQNKIDYTKHQIIITMGKEGAWLVKEHPEIEFAVEKFPVDPVNKPDVIGCGDVFLAGLVVEYMTNKDLYKAINFANKCARLSAKQQGTTEVRL